MRTSTRDKGHADYHNYKWSRWVFARQMQIKESRNWHSVSDANVNSWSKWVFSRQDANSGIRKLTQRFWCQSQLVTQVIMTLMQHWMSNIELQNWHSVSSWSKSQLVTRSPGPKGKWSWADPKRRLTEFTQIHESRNWHSVSIRCKSQLVTELMPRPERPCYHAEALGPVLGGSACCSRGGVMCQTN